MTDDGTRRLGPLGRRLLVAFVLVAVTSLVMVTGASLIGTSQGFSTNRAEQRAVAADATAKAVGAAYAEAGGWNGADLGAASAIATAAGARLVVRDVTGGLVSSPGHSGHSGAGGAAAAAGPNATASPVIVDGGEVGTVRLGFGPAMHGSGRQIAWTWTVVAAFVAIGVAIAVAWFVSRRITDPLTSLMAAVRGFAAGDRSRRARPDTTAAPGELGELARAFNATADSVVLSEATRRRMAADVAHELRTPITALQAGLEEVRDGYVTPDREVVARLHAQSVRLGRIVADLAELANAEAAGVSMTLTPLELGRFTTEAVAAAEPMLVGAGLSVATQIAADCWVQADEGRLHQVLGNLLSNAARHCRYGDDVVVRVFPRDGDVVLEVADSGPGIAEADLSRVFDRLWRGTADSDGEGLGIGLAVVKSLVEAHGGEVTARSRVGEGTTFVVKLPCVDL